ncbi:MAG: TonB-dependent receptor [Bacteroidota bacterium]
MKRLFLSLFFLAFIFCETSSAQYTKKILKKVVIDHFYTCTLDLMMDSLATEYHLPIYFEREQLSKMNVANHFFGESLMDVFKYVCKANDLQYWIENDGTIYLLQNPDDLARLKKLKSIRNTTMVIKPLVLEPPKMPAMHFGFPITGKVTDMNTGESLPGATVKIRNTNLNTVTNITGGFTILKVPSDTAVVEVSFVGYQPDVFRLDSKSINSNLVFSLYPSMNALNEVTITGKKSGVLNTDSKKVSVLQLSPAALDKLPNIGERDVMRAFQLMPGVSATNESSSGAYVRGGTPDQNLVTFDGFTVYQVDHLYGFFSAFNSNAVRDVQLLKGGFSAKYGGRLSSVTEIIGKDGNKNETNIGGDISLLSTNLYAETPVGKNSSALVSFRRSYQGPLYDKIFGKFNTGLSQAGGFTGGRGGGPGGRGGFGAQTTPSSYFYDINAKYVYTLSPGNSLAVSYYKGSDYLDNSRDMNLPSFTTGSSTSLAVNDNQQSGNTGAALKWNSVINHKLFANTTFSYSGFSSDRINETTGSSTDSGITKAINMGTREYNRLRDLSVKSDWEWRSASKFKWLFGGFSSSVKIDYNYNQNDTTQLINQHNTALIGGGYAELEIDPNNKWHIQPGLRSTYYGPTGKLYAEPRLSFSYHLNDSWNLKGATGRFYQFTNQVIREDITGGDRNFWVMANNSNIPVSSANHFIAGFNYETDQFLFDVEGYYKSLSGLTEYSIRQEGGGGGPFGGTRTATVTENFYQGSGYAKGIEFLLQKKAGMYTGWIGYTLAQAKSKFAVYGDNYFSSPQDITHEFKSINMYHWQRWSFAATFIFSTGHPYTAPFGTYSVQTLDGNKTTYLTISTKNGERLPDYHRLDLSATYDLLKIDGIKVGSIGLSLFNVYNHINSWYNQYYIRNGIVYTTAVKYLGFTPNLTLSLKWK